MRVRELAEWLGAPFEGDGEKELERAASLEVAGSAELSFVGNRRAGKEAESCAAGCLIVPAGFPSLSGRTLIRVADPRIAFARAVGLLHPAPAPVSGVHPTAVVAADAEVGPRVAIEAMAVIGSGSKIGADCQIGAGCSIGARVTLGDSSRLYANVTVYDDVDIGARAVLHSGCVIGADGFGFVLSQDSYQKFPQIGRVWVGDDVEIGANSCVDRAALGVTWIGDGVKLDNMVHVAHNCRIGRHVVVAAQTGFSGGVVVEDYAVIGGQVGIGDKARIESRAVLGSGSGVLTSKIVHAGQVMWGTPARPLKEYLETLANLSHLPEMRKELRELKRRLKELEDRAG